MRRAFTSSCVIAVVIAFGVAGCGGDDSTSSDSSTDTSADTSITKDEFITQANTICAAGNKEIDAGAQDAFSGGKPSQAEIESFANDVLIPSVETQLTAIAALPVPAGEEDQISAILDAANQALDETKADPAGVAGNQDPFGEANQLANDYGLTECGG